MDDTKKLSTILFGQYLIIFLILLLTVTVLWGINRVEQAVRTTGHAICRVQGLQIDEPGKKTAEEIICGGLLGRFAE